MQEGDRWARRPEGNEGLCAHECRTARRPLRGSGKNVGIWASFILPLLLAICETFTSILTSGGLKSLCDVSNITHLIGRLESDM